MTWPFVELLDMIKQTIYKVKKLEKYMKLLIILLSIQVLQSLIKDRRAKSLNELTSCSKTDTSNKYLSKSTQGRIPSTDDSTYQGRVSRSRDRMAVQRRTSRSLDIDDVGCQRRTGEATMLTVEEIWKPQGALTPQEEEPGEEVEGDVDAATNTCVDNPEGTDTDVNPDDDGVVMQRNLVQGKITRKT